MQNTLIAVLVAFCLVLGVGIWVTNQPEKGLEMEFYVGYEIEVGENWLGLDEFFFTDSVYHSLFYPLELVDQMTVEAKAEVLKRVLYNLTLEKPVFFRVENYQGDDTLVVYFELQQNEDGDMFIFQGSNYNMLTQKLIRRNREIDNTLAVFYHIKDGKLINHFYLEDPEGLERSVRKEQNLNNLADIYLMDADPENDQYIVDLLQQYQLEAEKLSSRFCSYLTLAEYYASIGDEGMFRITLTDAEMMLADSPELQTSAWSLQLQMIDEVHEIAKMLKQPLNQ